MKRIQIDSWEMYGISTKAVVHKANDFPIHSQLSKI